MTLTQLGAFVLVAKLGSVRAAADVLGVSEPAVSRALAALRQHLGDQLVVREGNGMALTDGGNRLFSIASQMVTLGAEAEAAVRTARGGPAPLRLLVTSTIAEFIATPLVEAFDRRWSGLFDTTSGVASAAEMRALLPNRLADVALGPDLRGSGGSGLSGTGLRGSGQGGSGLRGSGQGGSGQGGSGGPDLPGPESSVGLLSEPVLRYRLVVVGSPRFRAAGGPSQWPWLVDVSGTDPASDTGRLLRGLRVPDARIRVFPNQTAAWAAAADGAGVATAVSTLVTRQLRRGELCVIETGPPPVSSTWYVTTLSPERRTDGALRMRNFLATPDAMQLMCAPGTGVPPSRFRPPVYVTLWS